MITGKQTREHARRSRRIGLRTALIITWSMTSAVTLTSGCRSAGKRMADSNPSPGTPLAREPDPIPEIAPGMDSPPVKTVAFHEQQNHPSPESGTEKGSQDDSAATLQDYIALDSPDRVVDPVNSGEEIPLSESSAGLTLEAIESMALSNNPTIAELVATTQKAAGFKTQVGLRSNPSVGYSANQLADEGTDQHTFFISQTIITADKLALNRNVLNEALRAQLLQLEAQKYRIATDIRIMFYKALASQRQVELIHDFQSVVEQGLDIAEQLKIAQEGSQLEVVQAKVQKNEIDLALRQAQVRYDAAWRALAALAGKPEMPPMPLIGSLPDEEAALDWPSVAATMIASSPEVQTAQARVNQARANICRQEVQPIPNVNVQLASGVDNSTNSGLINLQIDAPIPLFNKNQGNISAARAEHARAAREVERIANSIKARLATVSQDYDSALVAVEQYSDGILPNAEEGLKLAELAYQAGETSFVQVLVARRTYFETNLQYITSQTQLAQARARVDGFVLTGALDAVQDDSGDDSLRGLTLGQQ